MNIQEELHKVFPIPESDVIAFLDSKENSIDEKLYVAEAHARFFQHLKNCVNTDIAKHKNIDTNAEIMAAMMANDHQALLNTNKVI